MERFSIITLYVSYIFLVTFYQKVDSASVQQCPQDIEIIVSTKGTNGSYESRPQSPSYSIPVGENIEVKCRSRVPVWIHFDGLLVNPTVSVISKRLILNSEDVSSFCYEVQATFQSEKEATGRYLCSDYSGRVNGTSAYIYAHRTSPPYLLYVSRREPLHGIISGERAILPCLSSNTNVPIKLFQGEDDLSQDSRVTYDPTVGFSFEISSFDNPYKTYTCVESWPQKNQSSSSGTFNVSVILVSPKEKNSSPAIEFVKSPPTPTNAIEYKCIGATSMTFISCNTPLECQFVRSCGIMPKRLYCTGGNDCSTSQGDCQSITLKDFRGQIFCSNDVYSISKAFFTDLSGRPVISDSDDADLNEISLKDKKLIDFTPTKYNTWENVDEFYFRESDTFQCNVSKLIGSEGIQWQFELTDGRRVPVPAENLSTGNETTYNGNTYYSKTSVIVFNDIKISKLLCLAPKINSDGWYIVSHNITMIESSPPIMNGLNESYTFPIFPNPTISCAASGPDISYNWYRNGQPISDTHSQFLNATVHNWISSTLSLFYEPDIDNGNTSDPETQVYRCKASNFLGSAEKYITVQWKLPSTELTGQSQDLTIIIASVAFLLICTMMAGLIFYRLKKTNNNFPEEDKKKFFNGDPSINNIYSNDDGEQDFQYFGLPYLMDKEIVDPDSNLIIGKISGSGNFGVVYKGILKVNGTEKDVAVKTLKEGASDKDFRDLLAELKLMQYVGDHENVIKFIGGVTKDISKRKAQIVVEFCHFSDLKSYLKNHKNLFQNEINITGNYTPMPVSLPVGYSQIATPMRTSDLIRWSYEIASGMEYLANKKLVHRDLAARNVLLSDTLVAKITDFGLSKNLYKNDKDYYMQISTNENGEFVLPWRWLSIEALQNYKFSTDSDIWAFGVTMWETFTLGDDPYPSLPVSQTPLLEKILEDGYRMGKPAHANEALYEIMLGCWQAQGSLRPRFSDLRRLIIAANETILQPQPQLNFPIELDNYMEEEAFYESDGPRYEDDAQPV